MRRPSNLMNTMVVPEQAVTPTNSGLPKNYLDLYGLSKPPFDGVTADVGFILFASHRRGFELLIDHLVNGSGVIILQGEEGIGKSETLRSAAAMAAETSLQTVTVSRPPNGRITLTQLVSALEGQAHSDTTTDEAISRFLEPPRKALLADDIDLMPDHCISVILSLARHTSNMPRGPAIILSTSITLPSDRSRTELAELVSLARNTVRLPRLGSAEIRQYIERSLWIAGGTTRRLITTDAMRLLISRSGGLPGLTNRLMEAALTAGFARGDPMITAKTIAAVMGPTVSRHRPPPIEQPSGRTSKVFQFVAFGLLLAGLFAFLYKGLNVYQDPERSAPPKPLHVGPPLVPAAPAQPPPVQTIPVELIAALIKHGDQALNLGDISAARLWYQRAVEAGSARAAIALGKTYDPNYPASGSAPDPSKAAELYQRAIALGDPKAAELLNKIGPH